VSLGIDYLVKDVLDTCFLTVCGLETASEGNELRHNKCMTLSLAQFDSFSPAMPNGMYCVLLAIPCYNGL